MRLGWIAAAALAFGASFAPAPASAYCRTASCEAGTGARCNPAQPTDCGKEIYWPNGCLSFSLQQDASSQVSLATAESIFQTAFATWLSADCGNGTHPRLKIEYTGPVACDAHEYNQDQKLGNANIIMFRDDGWPHQGAGTTLALTTVTYNLDTGEIYDADMELNSAQTKFSTGDTNVTFDLLSIATHEAGHFLGLAHTPDTTATMYTDYVPTSATLRDLADDDIRGICAAYPPGPMDSCDSTPRHGLASECNSPPDDQVDEGCCATAPGAPRQGGAAVIAALVGLVAWGARRRGR